MKVYELMSILAECPSGADVKCSMTITVPELENEEECGTDDYENTMYSVCKALDDVENVDEVVYLSF